MIEFLLQYFRDFLLVIAGGAIAMSSNFLIEIYRNKTANRDAFTAIKAEIESNIESAERAEMSEHLWSDNVYKANLSRLRSFRPNINKVVKFYFKIANYKNRYLQFVGIHDDLRKAENEHYTLKSLQFTSADSESNQSRMMFLSEEISLSKSRITSESNVLLLLAEEIAILGKEIIKNT